MEDAFELLSDARFLIGAAIVVVSVIAFVDHPTAANLRKTIAATLSL